MDTIEYANTQALYNKAVELGKSNGEAIEIAYYYNYNRHRLEATVFMTATLVQYEALRMVARTGMTKAKAVIKSIDEALDKGGEEALERFSQTELDIYAEAYSDEPDMARIESLGIKANIEFLAYAWANNDRFQMPALLEDGWQVMMDVISGRMSYTAFCKRMEPHRDEVVDAVLAPLRFSIDDTMTAGQRLMKTYKVPARALPLHAIADIVRFGIAFQAGTDLENMDRRLAQKNADGTSWKGHPRAHRTDYLMYLDRTIRGRSKPRKSYGTEPMVECKEEVTAAIRRMAEPPKEAA